MGISSPSFGRLVTGFLVLAALPGLARLKTTTVVAAEADGLAAAEAIIATVNQPQQQLSTDGHTEAAARSSLDEGSGRTPLTYSAVPVTYEPDAVPTACLSDTVTDSAFEVLHTFAGGNDGIAPSTKMIQARDGNLYGTTAAGGAFNAGVAFRMAPDGSGYTILHTFAGGTDGASPSALIEGGDGNFYGTSVMGGGATSCGSPGCGTVFQMTPAGTVTVLHAFTGGVNGGFPSAALLRGTDGNLYGTTRFGGDVNCEFYCGTIFKITPDGVFTLLYTFHGVDGAGPATPLVQGADGNLYGTTGPYCPDNGDPFCENGGTAFKLTPQGALTVLFHFIRHLRDELSPRIGGLTVAADGSLYGIVGPPGTFVYRVTANGSVTIVHTFTGGTDGGDIHGELIQAVDGNFYGTNYAGGFGCNFSGCGTVFVMSPSGTVAALYFFTGAGDGASPIASLVQARDRSFYGTTTQGGGANGGVAFRLAFTLTASPGAVKPGDPITVHWAAPPGRPATDWIGLFPVGAPNTDPVSGQYTNGSSCGDITFSAPDVTGQYEFRYLPNQGLTDVARSNIVTVTVLSAPRITTQPGNATIPAHTMTMLTVVADGVPAPTYQWYQGPSGSGTLIGGATSSTFVTPALDSLTDYWVRVTNPFGSVNSNTAAVAVTYTDATHTFTDPTLTTGLTLIRAVHIVELRTRTNAVRVANSLPAIQWTDPTLTPGGTMIKGVHVNELRSAITDVYIAKGLTPPTFTGSITSGTVIRAQHIGELRDAVTAVE